MANAKRVAKENDSVFVKRLKEIVGENATQKEIAGKVGVERATVGYWLSGKITPNSTTLQMIAKAYNVSVNWLIGNTDIKSADPNITTVCSFTGLSEKSIQKLADLTKYNNGSFKNCLDLFFTNPKFDMLPIALRKYLNTKSAHEDYKQKLISLLKQYNIQVTDIDKQAAQIYYIASTEPNGYDPNVVICAKAVAELKTELEFSEYMIQQSMVKILSEYNKEGE